MTATTLWVLLAFLPVSDVRAPVVVIERFPSQAQCLDLLAVFPPTDRVSFDCLPSRRIEARPFPEPQQ
jgi:hypothetical protein